MVLSTLAETSFISLASENLSSTSFEAEQETKIREDIKVM